MWLAHHGILGMKWGVRRYQNKDGSLTNAGRKRYNKLKSNQIERFSKPDIQSGDYYLKKGQNINRVISLDYGTQEELKEYEKKHKNDPAFYSVDDYLNRTQIKGRDFYANWFGDSGWQPDNIRIDDLILKNDTKVANGKKVIETFINKYGDIPISTLKYYNDNTIKSKTGDYSNLNVKEIYNMTDSMNIDEKYKYRYDDPIVSRARTVDSLFNTITNTISNDPIYRSEIIKDLKTEGYKAMEDVHDRISDMPIILFDRSDAKVVKSTSGLDYFKSKGIKYTD